MEKNLLLEINRVNELMGIKRKPLIMEQGLMSYVRMGMSKGLSLLDTLSSAADNMVLYGKMTREEADKAVNLIKTDTELMDDIKKSYTSSKTPGSAHVDDIESKVKDLINKTNSDNLEELIRNISNITQKEVDFITSDVVTRMISSNGFVNAGERFTQRYANVIKILRDNLDIEGVVLNLEDFKNFFNVRAHSEAKIFQERYIAALKEELDARTLNKTDYDRLINNPNETVGAPLMEFFENKYKYTDNSDITKLIDDYKAAGRLDEGAGTIPKPVHGKDMPDIAQNNSRGEGQSIFRNEPTQAGRWWWGPMLDGAGRLSTKWSDNFFFRYCKMGFCEAIIDFVRGIGRSPERFVDDLNRTIAKIDELYGRMSTMNPGDAGHIALKKEVDGYVNRLKSNAKMLQTSDNGFLTTWSNIEDNIRITLVSEDNPRSRAYADEFIKYIKDEAITSGGETIGQFIDLMKEYYRKRGNTVLFNLFEMGTHEFWRNWKNTKPFKYMEEVKAVWAKDPKNGMIVGRLLNTAGKVLEDMIVVGIKRSLNFLSLGTFRFYKDILMRLKTGRFTNFQGLKNYGLLYIELVIITNVIEPIVEFFRDLWDSYREVALIVGASPGPSPQDNLKSNFAAKLNFGSEFEWVPFYNPIPGTDGTHLGLKPAPFPNYLLDKITEFGEFMGFLSTRETKGNDDVIENRKTEIIKRLVPTIGVVNKELQTKWDASTLEEKEKIKQKNGFYKNYYDVLKYTYDDEIDVNYLKMILKSLEYNPRVDNETVMKMVDLNTGDFSTVDEKAKLLKDSKSLIADVKGYMTIKDKDDKKYRVILLPSSGELMYIEPSMDVLEKDPRAKTEQINITDFVNKLK